MYKLCYDLTGQVSGINKDGAFIPLCEGNTDYQTFLKWNSEQEVPLDLKSTIPVIPPEKSRDLAKEIDTLKAQVATQTTKITALESKVAIK
jgi:hypothetical protein